MPKTDSYLILGIGTEVGKTFLVENLCRLKPQVLAIKPIASGFSKDDKTSDTSRILAALGLENNKSNLDKICPWRFAKPVSPHLAGKIDYKKLLEFCRQNIASASKQKRLLFIESAGGVMTPITSNKTFLDLACDLKIPVLLVASNYLGAISHTLCAVEVLKRRKVRVEKIIINENFSSQTKSKDLIKVIENLAQIETLTLKQFLNPKNLRNV